MIDEGDLKRSFPGIPWDQPVLISIRGNEHSLTPTLEVWACRYCVALHGLKAQDVLANRVPEQAFKTRADALDHVDRVHHG